MTSPIEIAYVDIVPRTKDFRRILKKETEESLTNFAANSKKTADSVTADFRNMSSNIRESLRSGFSGGTSSVRSAITDIKREAARAGEAASGSADELANAFQRARTAVTQTSGTLARLAASGPVGIGAVTAAVVVLGGVVAVAARAVQDFVTVFQFGLAVLPGAITAVISSILILKAAFSGVGAAFEELTKKQDVAGASGVSNARQVADAQRGVLQAQKDLIKAKEDEIARIRELAIQIQRARATEARAADDVLKAEYALQRARDVGTPRSQIEAQLALDEAKASLVEAKADTKNLAAEKAKADKVGVNGSEQVLRAQEALIDAQDRLAQSQNTASAGIARQTTAFDGLTKSAQDFVLALVSAKEQLAPVQDALQEAFFQGTAPLLQPIVDSILELKPELTAVAAGFGDIFKEVLTFLGTPEAKEALRAVLVGVSEFLIAIKPAIGPLLKAFTALIGDSGQFGKLLGDKVATALLKIADFVSTVDIEQLFKDAKDAVKELTPFLTNLGSIVKSLFQAFEFAGKFIFPVFTVVLGGVADALNFIEDVVRALLDSLKMLVEDVENSGKKIVRTIKGLPDAIVALGTKFFNAGKSLITSFFDGIGKAGGFAADFAKNLANTFVRFFNNTVVSSINRGVKLIQDGINKIPGLSLSLPKLSNIPALETGGLITAESLFRGGEKGKKEAVLPLENSRVMAMIGNAIATAGGTGNDGGGITFAPGSIVIQFTGAAPSVATAQNIGNTIARSTASALERRNIRTKIRGI